MEVSSHSDEPDSLYAPLHNDDRDSIKEKEPGLIEGQTGLADIATAVQRTRWKGRSPVPLTPLRICIEESTKTGARPPSGRGSVCCA